MAPRALSEIIGTAVIDGDFRHDLLHNPQRVLPQFDLTAKESDAIASIRAGSLEQFATQLHAWITENGNGHHVTNDELWLFL